MERVFRYKLDFYYQQAIIYLLTLIAYSVIRGSFVEDEFTFVFNDPLFYVIVVFVAIAFGVLVLNRVRDRKLIVRDGEIVFHHRFHERVVPIADLEWIHIGRERTVRTAGRFQVIVFKLKTRRRLFRIRVGRYERERELLEEMHRIAERVPKGKRSRFRLGRRSKA